MAINRWEWSAMGVEVGATDRIVEQVVRSGLSPAKQRGFLGHLLLASVGATSPLSKETAAQYHRLQRDLGIALGPASLGDDDEGQAVEVGGFVGRLDFATGREVVRVA
jgi:hypothetical protein